MAFSPKNWQDLPSTATPLSAAALEDLEQRVTSYADSVVPSGTATYGEVTAKGDLLAGTADNAVAAVQLPTGFPDRAGVTSDSSVSSGVRFSAKVMPYNPYEVSSGVGQGVAATDTAALNTCGNAAAAAGGKMEIPASSTPLLINSTRWTIPSNLYCYGYGKDKSVVKVADGDSTLENIRNSNRTTGNPNITFDGIHFDGNLDNRPVLVQGMMFFKYDGGVNPSTNPDGFTMRNCHLTNSPGIHFLVYAYNNVLLENNWVSGGERDGLDCIACHGVRIIGNRVEDIVDDCIVFGGQQGQSLNTGTYGSDFVIAGNVVGDARLLAAGSGQGIQVNACRRGAITGNSINATSTHGIAIHPNNGMSTSELTVTGNTIRDPGVNFDGTTDAGWGIGIGGTSWFYNSAGAEVRDITVANNVVVRPKSHAIRLVGYDNTFVTQYLKFIGNTFVGTAGAAGTYTSAHGCLFTTAFIKHIQFQGNVFRDFNGRAVSGGSFANQFISFDGNYITNCARTNAGFAAIDMSNSVDVAWRNNKIIDSLGNHGAAVGWGGVTRGRIVNNDFYLGGTTSLSGTPTSGIQSNNIGTNGILYNPPYSATYVNTALP